MAASRVACSSFDIGANGVITITRDKSSYTHTIKFKFGNASGTIATKTTQTRIVWTPAVATLYAQIPNAVSGYGTITCETYDGNTLVGTTTAGFYAYAVKADCLPTVSAVIADTNAATIAVTGNSAILVCYISKPKVTVTATGKNSATIKSVQIYNPVGLVATSTPYTFDTVYSERFIVKVIDSRGYTVEQTFTAADFIDYVPCQFNSITLKRTESTSTTATATLKGYCFNGSFGSLNNTLTVKYRYKTSGGTYGSYTTVSGVTWNADGTFSVSANIPNLSLDETYQFEFVVEDKLSSFVFDEVILGKGTGDLRIGKDYILSKNNIIAGSLENTEWKGFRSRRTLGGNRYEANFGVGNRENKGVTAQELYKFIDGIGSLIGRTEIREDGFLYDSVHNMSFAEIMSTAPSIVGGGAQGNLLLNGGESVAPILFQWGRVNVTPDAANTVFAQKVNFTYAFQGTPFVTLDKATGAPATVDANVGDITSTGFTIYLQRTSAIATSILWFAIGNGSNALPE